MISMMYDLRLYICSHAHLCGGDNSDCGHMVPHILQFYDAKTCTCTDKNGCSSIMYSISEEEGKKVRCRLIPKEWDE